MNTRKQLKKLARNLKKAASQKPPDWYRIFPEDVETELNEEFYQDRVEDAIRKFSGKGSS
jgi:hypothetical protein